MPYSFDIANPILRAQLVGGRPTGEVKLRVQIMSGLDSLMDQFIVEYFRVNEKTCEQKQERGRCLGSPD